MKYLGAVKFTQDKLTEYRLYCFYEENGKIVLTRLKFTKHGTNDEKVISWKKFWDLYTICYELPYAHIEYIQLDQKIQNMITKEFSAMQI